MRTSFLARVGMASLGVSVVITLGCAEPWPAPTLAPTPTPTATPAPEPSAAQHSAALALFDAARMHELVTTSALTYATEESKVLFNGPCVAGIGSLAGSLDGGLSPTPGTFLPTGSHTYVVSFSKCLVQVSAFHYLELDGVASAAYSAAGWSNLTATVSAESVRAQQDGFSELVDVTADGSAAWTRVGSGTRTTTYTPAAGSRLVNNSTTNVATFGGGSYSFIQYSSPQRWERRFDNLKVAINGTEYTLNGSLVETSGFRNTFAGEIRILNNGTLVARFYGDGNDRRVEVLVPLVPF